MDWKREIIGMTQFKEAREHRIDATFFPPLSESAIANWQIQNDVELPEDWRSFYLQSDGMEAQKGELQPILPLKKCSVLPISCSRQHPMVEFGKSPTHRYYLNLGLSQSVYRVEEFGSEEEFFTSSLERYLEAVFRARA